MEEMKDSTVPALEKPQNLEELQDLLIIDDKHRRRLEMDRREVKLRAKHYHNLIEVFGHQGLIKQSVSYFMSEIKASGMDADSRLVADLLFSCSLAYPNKKDLVIKGLGECSSYIDKAGEGIAIALLEITNRGNCPAFESYMFDAFNSGVILSAMAGSLPTSAGSGRLTNAIEMFTSALWVNSEQMKERRKKIRFMLKRWDEVLVAQSISSRDGSRAPTLELFLKIDSKHKPSFLEKFAEELTQRYFMRSTLGFRFYAIKTLG